MKSIFLPNLVRVTELLLDNFFGLLFHHLEVLI